VYQVLHNFECPADKHELIGYYLSIINCDRKPNILHITNDIEVLIIKPEKPEKPVAMNHMDTALLSDTRKN
jgi:hypothetical protein